ncbi:MAG: antibiotic biosynthesis monooxygenase [Ramlibacter sp.]
MTRSIFANLLRATVALGGLAAALTSLQGCAISTPIPRLSGDSHAGQQVLLVLTTGVLHQDRRAEFDRQTGLVASSLRAQPGLIAQAIRREVFGPRVWTLTVWKDAQALDAFTRGLAHRQAVATSMPALIDMRSRRIWLPAGNVPQHWDAALELLADDSLSKAYWQ